MKRLENILANDLNARIEMLATEGWEPVSIAPYLLEPTYSMDHQQTASPQGAGGAQGLQSYRGPSYVATSFMVVFDKVNP